MVAGADQIGRMEEQSAQETTCSRVETSRVLVRILLIALVVSMTSLAPDQADALLVLIGV